MATRKPKRTRKGPTWAKKKAAINAANKRVAAAIKALQQAQTALSDVTASDPGGPQDITK